jgi:hypothetical protein
VNDAYLARACTRKAKAQIVVAVGRIVPVPVRGAKGGWVVVPATAADDTVNAVCLSAWVHCMSDHISAQVACIGMPNVAEQGGQRGRQPVIVNGTAKIGVLF